MCKNQLIEEFKSKYDEIKAEKDELDAILPPQILMVELDI